MTSAFQALTLSRKADRSALGRSSPLPLGEGSRALIVALALLATPALAQEPGAAPDRPLPSAAQEARAQALFEGVRCVVCQHESIADSPAGIAADMRRLVRDEIASGATDAQIKQDLVRRWGDYILFKPPVNPATWLLWFGPGLAALAVLGGLMLAARRNRPSTAPLTADEEARLRELLQGRDIRRDPDADSPNDGR